MKIGLIGLGKMGINIGKQFIARNHQAVGYAINQGWWGSFA
ncbi:6-phosphogluconate dehydrogenase, NAD(+)-dependent, decarboxylating [Bacillus stercoris]